MRLEFREGRPYLYDDDGIELLGAARRVEIIWDVTQSHNIPTIRVELVAPVLSAEVIAAFNLKLQAVCPQCGFDVSREPDKQVKEFDAPKLASDGYPQPAFDVYAALRETMAADAPKLA